mgnify:CR=1 FL=1
MSDKTEKHPSLWELSDESMTDLFWFSLIVLSSFALLLLSGVANVA